MSQSGNTDGMTRSFILVVAMAGKTKTRLLTREPFVSGRYGMVVCLRDFSLLFFLTPN